MTYNLWKSAPRIYVYANFLQYVSVRVEIMWKHNSLQKHTYRILTPLKLTFI